MTTLRHEIIARPATDDLPLLRHRKRKFADRRGAVMVLAAVFIVIIMGVVAFALDIGRIELARTQLQNAADAAAMAGALTISSGTAAAQTAAVTCGQANTVMGASVSITSSADITMGALDKTARTFASGGTGSTNAIRVVCQLSSARGNALPLLFAPILGQSSMQVSATSTATYQPTYSCGFVGLTFVTISGGSYTDSYDSTVGAYTAGSAGNKGSVCSNGAIGLSGGSTIVKGDVDMGPSGSFSASGGSHITGSQVHLSQAITEAAVNSGNASTVNNNSNIPLSAQHKNPVSSGAFNLSGGDSVTLPSGTYYFSTATLSGGSTITLGGPVVMYVAGKVDFSGGSVANSTANPANFILNAMGTTVTLSGSTQTYAEIYAPTADITRSGGGSDFFGTMVGKSLTLSGGGGLHYDTSLGSSSVSSALQMVQ